MVTRVRIGHTYLTHEYLFDNSSPPKCSCNNDLTIEHLFSCSKYEQQRKALNVTFATVSDDNIISQNKILQYFKQIKIYDKI